MPGTLPQSDVARQLIEAIDGLLEKISEYFRRGVRTEEDYKSLVLLHGHVDGFSATLGLRGPPPLEDARLLVYRERLPGGGYVPLRGANLWPPAAWQEQLYSLRAAAEIMALSDTGRVGFDFDAYLTPRNWAEQWSLPLAALDSRLKRWRRKHPEQVGRGWMEANDRGPREAQYIYRGREILPVLEALRDRHSTGEKVSRE
jgi:hypothetical protein